MVAVPSFLLMLSGLNWDARALPWGTESPQGRLMGPLLPSSLNYLSFMPENRLDAQANPPPLNFPFKHTIPSSLLLPGLSTHFLVPPLSQWFTWKLETL